MRPAHRHTRHFLTLAALCAATAAGGARPLVTDDPGVLERGQCEVEAVQAADRVPGEPRLRGRSLQLGCGIGARSQAALALAQDEAGGERTRGMALAGKTALPATEAWALAWGLAWQRAPGSGWRHAESAASLLVAGEAWAGGTWVANLGHARDMQARQGSTTWGLGLEQAVGESVAVAGEFHGDDRQAPWWNLGLRWEVLPERLSLDLSYGRQISTGRPQRLTLGAKLSF